MKSRFQTWFVRLAILGLVPLFLSGCGSSYSAPPGPTTYTIGGTVSNLATGNSVVLQDNGGSNLTVNANGSFTFTSAVSSSGAYAVTVSSQPSNPAQICIVTNGSGTVNANVTDVAVNCGHNEWEWKGGSNSNSSGNGNSGVYGTQGTAAASNVPGSRNFGAVSWTDAAGNLWLFGGSGNDSAGTVGDLNDLWKYNVASGEWTWVSGLETANQTTSAVYGTLNTPNSANMPGERDSAVGWIDSSGNLWLFGGEGYDSMGKFGYLNDLWEYAVANNEWTWKGGQNVANQPGNYGTLKVAAATNMPGARGFSTVQNINGVVWLFGGFGNDSTPAPGQQDNLNDLWQYTISAGEWTWMGGLNLIDQVSIYGTLGTPSSTTVPGSRYSPASWTDTSGNIWLFGGEHLEVNGTTVDYFNDLWEYSIVSNNWTWKGGPNVINQKGIYPTTQGTAAATSIPGARGDVSSWTDPSGNFWLFGGFGLDSAGALPGGDLNDLWEYSVTTNEWTWQRGSNIANQIGVYGTEGQLAPSNVPGNREGASSWTDSSGNLWLFGGAGMNSINDLWMYLP